MPAAGFLLTWAGIAAICFQVPAQRTRCGMARQALPGRCLAVSAGVFLLGLSLTILLVVDHASFAIVAWISQAGLTGLLISLGLPFAGVGMLRLSQAAAVLGIVLIFSSNQFCAFC